MTLLTLLLFIAGLLLLISGAEALVRGASRLATAAGITPLVIGLTVVAFGTSTPELAVSVQSAFSGQAGADIAVGNIVGSNIFNVLFILGLSAAIVPLVVSQRLIRIDVPIMLGVSILALLLALDGGIGRGDGLLLFSGVIVYTIFAVVQGRSESTAVQAEYAREFGAPVRHAGGIVLNLVWIAAGLGLLVLGSVWLVDGALAMARALGISELVIGLTIVAIGTSLPEVATSVTASLKGERDIAVGNIIGSNIFNILAVLGLTAIVTPDGVHVSAAALRFDIPVMIAVTVICLPIFLTGSMIARWEGWLFLGYYGAYTGYLYLAATEHAIRDDFTGAMVLIVIPLTVMTLAASVWWSHDKNN